MSGSDCCPDNQAECTYASAGTKQSIPVQDPSTTAGLIYVLTFQFSRVLNFSCVTANRKEP